MCTLGFMCGCTYIRVGTFMWCILCFHCVYEVLYLGFSYVYIMYGWSHMYMSYVYICGVFSVLTSFLHLFRGRNSF